MQWISVDAGATQFLDLPVHAVLGAHEHDGFALAGSDAQHHLVAGGPLADEKEVMGHGIHCSLHRGSGMDHRVMEELLHQLVDVAVKRRRKQQALAFSRS